jgi:hypothetical protein
VSPDLFFCVNISSIPLLKCLGMLFHLALGLIGPLDLITDGLISWLSLSLFGQPVRLAGGWC